MPVRLKRCSGPCGQSYPFTHYWSDAGAPDGRMSRCPECEKLARQQRREARANGEAEGTPDRNGRKVHFSEEERQRRSELAKRLHAEGRFGGSVIGARGGVAVKRHRLTDSIVERFREPDNQDLVYNTIRRAMKGKNRSVAARTAFQLLQMDEKVAERERADRGGATDPSAMTHEELEAFVMQGVAAMIERGELPADVVLDPDSVVEVD